MLVNSGVYSWPDSLDELFVGATDSIKSDRRPLYFEALYLKYRFESIDICSPWHSIHKSK